MNRRLHRIGKFYSSIFMGNIGLFIFIGLLSVIFQEHGWLPNKEIYNISQLVYEVVLPVCIGYVGGEKIAGRSGGILAVLLVAGAVTADAGAGVLAAMIAGPVGGILWKYVGSRIKTRAGYSLQMLAGNLVTGILGGILAVFGYYVLTPFVLWAADGFSVCIRGLVENHLLVLAHVFIEPLKVLFLNNIINHGILVPLGMNQLQETGSSVLFLLESNPGPGFGMLLALFVTYREQRGEYGVAMFAQGGGGIHEVYFPYVLANLWLLLPLIFGGAAGTLWFERMHVGLTAPVSPGSIVTILLMAGRENLLTAAGGIVISAAVSFGGSILVLRLQKYRRKASREACENTEITKQDNEEITGRDHTGIAGHDMHSLKIGEEQVEEERKMPLKRIGFVCDAGVGSSAMGATLFRRKLAQNGIQGIEVQAYASDQIPENLDLIVCQKDFLRLLPESTKEMEIAAVDSLMGGEAFEGLLTAIKERNR